MVYGIALVDFREKKRQSGALKSTFVESDLLKRLTRDKHKCALNFVQIICEFVQKFHECKSGCVLN